MAGEAHLTLDSGDLRSRLRRDYSSLTTVRQPVRSPRPSFDTNDFKITPRPASPVHEQKLFEPTIPEMNHQSVAPATLLPVPIPAPLDRPNDAPNTKTPKRFRFSFDHAKVSSRLKDNKKQSSLVALAVLIAVLGAYFSFAGWHNNHIAQVQAARLTSEANKAAASGSSKSPALSTIKPTPAAISSYVVAPNLPRYLIIPKLGVDARIFSVGVTSTGALGTPNNVYDTDWYDESAEPGQPGAMLIDGHVSSWTAHGVFYGIKKLVAGNTIMVKRGDGTVFTYKVVRSQVFPSGNVNMTAAMTPVVAGTPGLNLITCTGDVIPGTNLFNERIVVFAEQVST